MQNGMPASFAASRREDFAVAVLHAAQPDRGERDRQRRLLPDNGGGQVALVDIDQHALAQLDPLHVGAVGAEGLLGIGAGIDILEEGARHALFASWRRSSMQVIGVIGVSVPYMSVALA